MLELRAGTGARDAAKALHEGARSGRDVIGGNDNAPERILSAYRRWIGVQILQIGQWLADSELDGVLTTKRYWALQNLNSSTFTQADLADFVRLEVGQRIETFVREAEALDHELSRWGSSRLSGESDTVAVVLDTNVLLTHHSGLESFPWHKTLNTQAHRHLGLAVPLQVVRELDRHKMASNNNVNRGTRNELRHDAGAALRFIDEGIPEFDGKHWLRRWEVGGRTDLSLMLIANRTPGFPIPDADTEIIERAVSLRPFATDVHFVSYDAAAVFQARQSGLKATKLTYMHAD
ncbi:MULTISPECIES: PIN domain-containing protein [unclassified Frondihabitans]|uniref:PIN domain-containing protein n=1 Tax=unclassified Frondihabitans TaxID=2626248 RepID=UPI000F4DD384|nr:MULTISPECIES: PIN domain-containing protein [unclassified Frondihabitans]RPE76004.1 PIN domain-containing protein [Frondihabitans sp. PhB153]RPF05719.1 PIN domain-containing protein [Frondihabitans sp. PhB161]